MFARTRRARRRSRTPSPATVTRKVTRTGCSSGVARGRPLRLLCGGEDRRRLQRRHTAGTRVWTMGGTDRSYSCIACINSCGACNAATQQACLQRRRHTAGTQQAHSRHTAGTQQACLRRRRHTHTYTLTQTHTYMRARPRARARALNSFSSPYINSWLRRMRLALE